MGLRKTNSPEALRGVVERTYPRDMHGLIRQMREGSVEERRWAVRDLAGHPAAASAVGEQILRETDASVREAIFTTLGTHATDAAAQALLPLLRSEDALLRNHAIETLARMPEVVAPHIAGLLHDADPDVRIFTINLLGEIQHPKVGSWLVEMLQRDPLVNAVAAAIEVLAEVGEPEHLPALHAVVRRFPDDPFIGFAVEMAARRIEAP